MLTILSSEETIESDEALAQLARFLGLPVEIVPLAGDRSAPPPVPGAGSGGRALALGQKTLRRVYEQAWFAALLKEAPFAFVYGFGARPEELPELKWFTAGACATVANAGAATGENRFAVDAQVVPGFPVSGRSFAIESSGLESAAAFAGPRATTPVTAAITVNGRPYFLRIDSWRAVRFLLAEPALVSIDLALVPEQSLRPWYAQLIAQVLFLRTAFGDGCWTSPVTGATLIIDDPYLKPRYGFVRYAALLPELERLGGALTVAFIPFNYRRSDPATVALARQFASRFSIAVHGCDHTAGEYASTDEVWLKNVTARALSRMDSHAAKTLMPYDNVMVFPQGRFSISALQALAACGIAAAVNSGPWPVDSGQDRLTIRDLLEPAVTRHGGVPIFLRHYPDQVFDYAFDALFQKPVLAVEHHAYFRGGYRSLAELVREVSSLSPKVTWLPLASALAASYQIKRTNAGRVSLRHFMPELRFRNPAPTELHLAMEMPQRDGQVQAIMAGGREVPFEVRAGRLTYAIDLRPGEEVNVTVRPSAIQRPSQPAPWKYRLRVQVRRTLSDLRDNHLARNERLLNLAAKTLKRFTGKKPAGP